MPLIILWRDDPLFPYIDNYNDYSYIILKLSQVYISGEVLVIQLKPFQEAYDPLLKWSVTLKRIWF